MKCRKCTTFTFFVVKSVFCDLLIVIGELLGLMGVVKILQLLRDLWHKKLTLIYGIFVISIAVDHSARGNKIQNNVNY